MEMGQMVLNKDSNEVNYGKYIQNIGYKFS